MTQFRQIAGGADDGDGWETTSVEKNQCPMRSPAYVLHVDGSVFQAWID